MDQESQIQPEAVNLKAWDPEKALASISDEQSILGQESETQMSTRIFRENLPMASHAIVHLAQYSPNDKVRLDAAKYVVERNLGRLQDGVPMGEDDPLEALLGSSVQRIEDFANTGGTDGNQG